MIGAFSLTRAGDPLPEPLNPLFVRIPRAASHVVLGPTPVRARKECADANRGRCRAATSPIGGRGIGRVARADGWNACVRAGSYSSPVGVKTIMGDYCAVCSLALLFRAGAVDFALSE